MNKNILLACFVLILTSIASCKKDSDDETFVDFDHEAQITIDRDSIYSYLATHYYNTNDSIIYTIGNVGANSLPIEEQLPLKNDPNLDSITGIDANGLEAAYTLYYYEISEGIDNGNVGFSSPSTADGVFVKFTGTLLDSTVFDSVEDYPVWYQLSGTIKGWRRGLSKFKRGTFTTENGDFIFENPGKGYIIFPSGLGFLNGYVGGMSNSTNSCLIFRIELDDVKLSDGDSDGIPTKFEVTFDEGLNIIIYDTDGDGYADSVDVDDDNDYTSTLAEVKDEYPLDVRGNYDFDYDELGKNIVAKGTTDGIPNYKNAEKNLE